MQTTTTVKDKILDAVSAYAQANERVIGELVELGSSTAREGIKTYLELQAAALEAARGLSLRHDHSPAHRLDAGLRGSDP